MTSLPATSTSPAASSRQPWFTLNPLSTKAFGPGHVIGAGILVFGTIAVAKGLIAHHAAKIREQSARRVAENDRGQYGERRSP
jgi:hypothetical protein